ncbi:MAG: hypothetical protein FJ368_01410 [Pelagibacterales bacterium]|nr:hypothetical protein [Pelagibacterales bacterium]
MLKFASKSIILLTIFFSISSCALSGRSKDDGVFKFITGAAKVSDVKDVHIVNVIRAIGMPDNSTTVGRYKYYKWNYSRTMGVSTIFGGGSTTFYCNLSVETKNSKVQLLNWYGNQCSIFLDQINDYFQNKLNIVVISDEDFKQQTVSTKKFDEIKQEKEVLKVENLDNVLKDEPEKVTDAEDLQEKNEEKLQEEKKS